MTTLIPNAVISGGSGSAVQTLDAGGNVIDGTLDPISGRAIVSVGALLGRTSAHALRRSRSQPQQVTTGGLNSLVPIVFGRQQVGAKIGAVLINGNTLLLLCAWCVGEIDAIESILIDNLPPIAGVTLTHYTGAAGQGIDPTLQAAYLAQGITYADVCAGVAYSVVSIPAGKSTSFPTLLATLRGLKVPLTSGGTPTWTQNPAYCLAYLVENQVNGMGASVSWADVATVAADCASMIGSPSETKRLLNIIIDQSQPAEQWINTLRDYCGCFAIPEAGTYVLPLDAAGSTVWTFGASNIVEGSMQVTKKAALNQPTVIVVTYTDTSQSIYTQQRVSVYADGVLAGTTPRRVSQVPKPGITRYSEAYRYAVERLNQAQLSDVNIQFTAFDEGVNIRAGDLIAVNHPIGFGPVTGFSAGKPFRVLQINPADAGRWQITAAEYDPNQYSMVVVSAPSTADTTLPSPASPPSVTGLTIVEEVYQVQTGLYASRLRVTWADASTSYPFVASYAIALTQSGTSIEVATVSSASQTYVTGPLKENLLYVASVEVRSSIGALGPSSVVSITNNGKMAKPSDVPSITGFEVGGEVRLSWVPATDLDLTAHEIRYSTTAGSWATATLIDRIAAPSVRYNTKVVPAGTWRFWIKGLDSVRSVAYPYGQESVDATYVDIVVTSDATAFVATNYAFSSPTLSFMSAAAGGGWISDYGGIWNTIFSSTLSTYTNDLATYSGSGASGIITETFNAGVSLTGDWFVGMTYTDLAGTAVPYIELSAGPDSAKTITAATNATPIVVTATAHGYSTGDEVQIASVGGNTNANGLRTVTVIDANTFSLQDLFGTNIAGNAAYTSGGTSQRWVWSKFQALTVKQTAQYARTRLTTTGTAYVSALGSVRCNVVARQEGGTVATVASGPTIVTLANHYNACVSVIATASKGSTPLFCVYDNVEVDGARGVGVGEALLFDGLSNYVDVSDATPLHLTQPLTLEAQIKLTAITGVTQGIARKDTETGTRYMWGIQIGISGRVEAVYTNTANYIAQSLQPPALGRWMHVAMTISGTTVTLFVDGILQSTATISGTQSYPTGRMSIGSNPPNVVTGTSHLEYFGGRIDDVRVWNIARTQAQIQAAMNTPLIGNETGLVGYWKFDSLSGTTATDSTSNANNGTVSGAKWRPLNGMDLYTYDATGTQQAGTAAWAWSGV